MSEEKPAEQEQHEEVSSKLIQGLKYQITFNGLKTKSTLHEGAYKQALIKAKGSISTAVEILKKEGAFNQQKQKQYYTVELTGNVPVILTYRVFSDNPEDAIRQVERNIVGTPFSSQPKIQFARFRKIQARVLKFGTNMVEYLKNF